MLYYIIVILAILPFLIIFPIIVRGRKNMPKGKMLFCCNHQSNWDVLLIAAKIPGRRFYFMSKESLFKNKFCSFILKKLGAYPVSRNKTDISAIKKTLSLLKDEKAICLFPEGARLKTEDSNELRDGAIIFALKSKAPIVPACFIKKPKPFCFNKLIIGKPFNLSEMEEFKEKKITVELIEKGREILRKKMFGLYNQNIKK